MPGSAPRSLEEMKARITPSNRIASRSGSPSKYHHCSLFGLVSILTLGGSAATVAGSTFVPTSSTISALPAANVSPRLRKDPSPARPNEDTVTYPFQLFGISNSRPRVQGRGFHALGPAVFGSPLKPHRISLSSSGKPLPRASRNSIASSLI